MSFISSYVYVKNPNGTTYVYENESYWDKTEKKTKHRRKCVGKLDPLTKEIVPSRKKGAAEKKPDSFCTVLTTGPSLLLEQAAKKTGLLKVLRTVFPKQWVVILTGVYYLISEGKKAPFEGIEQWCTQNAHPGELEFSYFDLADFISDTLPHMRDLFFQSWMETNQEKEFLAFQVKSVPSYREWTDTIRREEEFFRENLPQIPILVVAGEESRIPFYYQVLPRNLAGAGAIENCLHRPGFPVPRAVTLFLEREFWREDGLDVFLNSPYQFAVSVPLDDPLAYEAIQGNQLRISYDRYRLPLEKKELYAVTLDDRKNGLGVYLHTFCDRKEVELQEEKFFERLAQWRQELSSGKTKPENRVYYDRYFTVINDRSGKQGFIVNEMSLEEHRIYSPGWYVVASDRLGDAASVWKCFELRDEFAHCFDDLWNGKDFGQLEIDEDKEVDGRLFLQFLGRILTTYLNRILSERGWTSYYTLEDIFTEMKSLKQVYGPSFRKKWTTKPTTLQESILDLYQIVL